MLHLAMEIADTVCVVWEKSTASEGLALVALLFTWIETDMRHELRHLIFGRLGNACVMCRSCVCRLYHLISDLALTC